MQRVVACRPMRSSPAMFGDGEEDSWQRNIEYQDYEAGRSWASGRKELRTSVSGRQHGGGGRPDAQGSAGHHEKRILF